MCFFACAPSVFAAVRVHACLIGPIRCVCNGPETAATICFGHWMYQIRDKTLFTDDS